MLRIIYLSIYLCAGGRMTHLDHLFARRYGPFVLLRPSSAGLDLDRIQEAGAAEGDGGKDQGGILVV